MTASGTITPDSVGPVETRYIDLPDPILLDCDRLLHSIRIAYETYGELSTKRDNAIMVEIAVPGRPPAPEPAPWTLRAFIRRQPFVPRF